MRVDHAMHQDSHQDKLKQKYRQISIIQMTLRDELSTYFIQIVVQEKISMD